MEDNFFEQIIEKFNEKEYNRRVYWAGIFVRHLIDEENKYEFTNEQKKRFYDTICLYLNKDICDKIQQKRKVQGW